MKLRCACCYFLTTVAVGVGVFPNSVRAQISSDGTLSTTVSTNDAVNFLIEGGERSLDNLFHSFSKFSIPNLGSAYFNNATDITNIFSRVTGGNISDIQGLIRANSTANLFLINPAGIVFGENVSLDVGGSFFATTAESVVFGDDIEFSAIEPQEAPLLTINITPGLQMGANSGDITVTGEGHALTGGFFFPFNFNDTATGLQVNPGETLGLIGREINLTGGIIRVPGGNLQLLGIQEGTLRLDNTLESWQLNNLQVEEFGDINLSEKTFLDNTGFITGDIHLEGKNITLEDGSIVLIQHFGNQPSGNIIVNATGTIALADSVRNAPEQVTPFGTISGVITSRFTTQTLGTGKGGNLVISGSNLSITDGSSVMSSTFTDADTGGVDISIEQLIEIDGFSPLYPFITSTILSYIASGNGTTGTINVSAENINIINGAAISSSNFGTGQGGNVQINVREDLNIGDINPIIAAPASIGGTTYRTGEGGNVEVNATRISIFNSGIINTAALAEGDAGQVTVNASESITIRDDTPQLETFSAIASDASILDLTLRQALGVPDQPSGDSGEVVINTPLLTVTELGRVSVINQGTGNSGSLEINTDKLILNEGGNITALSTSGQGGNISLNIQDYLLLRNGGAITAEATGRFASKQLNVDGGNIEINSNLVTLIEGSQINANAFEGNGGNITITTQGLFVSPNSAITASSQFGVDGTITLNTPDEENKLAIAELPENFTDASEQIAEGCEWTNDNTFYVTGRSGIAKTPQEHIQDYTMWSDIRDLNQLSARRQREEGNRQERIIEANAWIINERGNVELVAVVPSNNQNLRQVASSCSGDVNS